MLINIHGNANFYSSRHGFISRLTFKLTSEQIRLSCSLKN